MSLDCRPGYSRTPHPQLKFLVTFYTCGKAYMLYGKNLIWKKKEYSHQLGVLMINLIFFSSLTIPILCNISILLGYWYNVVALKLSIHTRFFLDQTLKRVLERPKEGWPIKYEPVLQKIPCYKVQIMRGCYKLSTHENFCINNFPYIYFTWM